VNYQRHITSVNEVEATFGHYDVREHRLYTLEGGCLAWPSNPNFKPGQSITFKDNAGWFSRNGKICYFSSYITNLMAA
jgi:hypothetical protein